MYLSSDDIASGRQAMADVFNGWKRTEPVRFYFTQNEVVVSDTPSYLSDFQDFTHSYSGVVSTGSYVDLDARIIYLRNVDLINFVPGGDDLQVRAQQDFGKIKIQIPASGLQYLKDAERFTYNGQKYQRTENWRGLGIFGYLDYYSIVLSEVV